MLLPKFDILNKIKKERTITLANAIIIAFAAFGMLGMSIV